MKIQNSIKILKNNPLFTINQNIFSLLHIRANFVSYFFHYKNHHSSLFKYRNNIRNFNLISQSQKGVNTMKKFIRYSIYGFKPQYQSHHLEQVKYHLNDFNITKYPKHLQYAIQEQHDRLLPFYQEHYDDFENGIWFFLEGYKSNFDLNHLRRKVPCWKAEIEDDAIVYDPNWEKILTLDDSEIKIRGCYLPKRELYKIHHIPNTQIEGIFYII